MTSPLMLLSVQIGDETSSHLVAMAPGDAAALLDTLKTCTSLMPGEVAQRLSAVFAPMQGLDVIPSPEELWAELPPPPAEMDMTPPADPLEEVLTTPAPQPLPHKKTRKH